MNLRFCHGVVRFKPEWSFGLNYWVVQNFVHFTPSGKKFPTCYYQHYLGLNIFRYSFRVSWTTGGRVHD